MADFITLLLTITVIVILYSIFSTSPASDTVSNSVLYFKFLIGNKEATAQIAKEEAQRAKERKNNADKSEESSTESQKKLNALIESIGDDPDSAELRNPALLALFIERQGDDSEPQ